MRFDAYRALDFLVHQPFINPQRVFVVGFSQGGMLALLSIERGLEQQLSANKFRAALSIALTVYVLFSIL